MFLHSKFFIFKTINAIINNKGLKDNGVITNDQYRANLNNILKSCPQYDLTGLVKKNVVSDVCYGCDQPWLNQSWLHWPESGIVQVSPISPGNPLLPGRPFLPSLYII